MNKKLLINIFLLFIIPALITYILFSVYGLAFSKSKFNINEDFKTFNNFRYILLHNQTIYLIILSGIFLFKIPTIISLISNGLSFGFYYAGIRGHGISSIIILLHAIPELLAFFIGALIVFKGLMYYRNNKVQFVKAIFFSEFLLLMAAALENYVTPNYFK